MKDKTKLLNRYWETRVFNLSKQEEERARHLHEESIVVDSQGISAAAMSPEYTPSMWRKAAELVKVDAPLTVIISELEHTHVEDLVSGKSDIEREWMELSGVDAFHATVSPPGAPFEVATRNIALWQRKFDSLDYLIKATSYQDIEDAKTHGKRAIIMGFQDTEHFGRDLNRLGLFYDLGIRIIQLTYNLGNFVGSGCTERADGGLSYFGIEVIKHMNELGILIDVSHCGDKTTMDAIEISKLPVAVTHSFSHTLYAHDRSKTDEQLKALAARNGYCGIIAVPFFLSDLSQREASLNDMLDHIDYVVRIMGVDKVGIGTDWAGPAPEPVATKIKEQIAVLGFRGEHGVVPDAIVKGFKGQREWPNITRGLVSRDYNDDEIKGILGGNFLRLFKQVVG